jgi:hypothetical protein
MLPGAIALQRMKPISRRNAQVIELDRCVDRIQLAHGASRHLGGHATGRPSAKQDFGPTVGKAPDHGAM